MQVTGRAEVAGLTDREALQSVLSDRANRYLVRQAMCRATNVDYRLDTASARAFLGQYVTLP